MVERERELGERVRCAVERLRGVRGASLDVALDVGRIVVDALYGGDVSRWRARTRKDHALRSLSRRGDLPLSASALYRALALYELSQREELQGGRLRGLGVSHLRAVLGLPASAQGALLAAAAREGWTVARLEQEALGQRSPGSRGRGGRKATAPYIKSIRRIVQLTSPEALAGLERCGELDATELEELARGIGRARAQLTRLAHVLPKRQARVARKAPRGGA